MGILIDTVAFKLRLPADKLQRLQVLILGRHALARSWSLSLGTCLMWQRLNIRPGRTFLRELFRLMHLAKAPHHYVRLSAGAKADLAWWKCFLQSWNGSSFFPLPYPSAHVYSDASGSFGSGAVVDQLSWFQLQWQTRIYLLRSWYIYLWYWLLLCGGGTELASTSDFTVTILQW